MDFKCLMAIWVGAYLEILAIFADDVKARGAFLEGQRNSVAANAFEARDHHNQRSVHIVLMRIKIKLS